MDEHERIWLCTNSIFLAQRKGVHYQRVHTVERNSSKMHHTNNSIFTLESMYVCIYNMKRCSVVSPARPEFCLVFPAREFNPWTSDSLFMPCFARMGMPMNSGSPREHSKHGERKEKKTEKHEAVSPYVGNEYMRE